MSTQAQAAIMVLSSLEDTVADLLLQYNAVKEQRENIVWKQPRLEADRDAEDV